MSLRQNLIGIALLLAALALYLPGLHGPWLVDDGVNLGVFLNYAAGQAPYQDIIFGNHSGPLGRSVAMASFALNHVLDLFDTHALKAGNLLLHGLNGLLLFALLRRLFQQRSPTCAIPPDGLAALLSLWWLCLPLHTSTVLYIVQRMTLLAATFSLASVLFYVLARLHWQQRWHAGLYLALSLLLCLPLAIFSKESAAITPVWLLLLEAFFLQHRRRQTAPLLGGLLLLTLLALLICTLFPPPWLTAGYISRPFSLNERMLTEPRILFSYIHDIFLPAAANLGLFHDDIRISRSLFDSPATALSLAGILALLGVALASLRSARWWPLSLGLLLYFSGHLIESTLIPLELYFEHRNYLPSAGLLLAAATLLLNIWPWSHKSLLIVFLLYIVLLCLSTAQRSITWGSEQALLHSSAHNHPHSLRAQTDYAEWLFSHGQANAALQLATEAVQNQPETAAIFQLQMITFYCRSRIAPPAALVHSSAAAMAALKQQTLSLNIGLDAILQEKQDGWCGETDFSAWGPALLAQEKNLQQHYRQHIGGVWLLRYTISRWLSLLGYSQEALAIQQSVWDSGDRNALPSVGLDVASLLVASGRLQEAEKILAELVPVTQDAPADFRRDVQALHATIAEKRKK